MAKPRPRRGMDSARLVVQASPPRLSPPRILTSGVPEYRVGRWIHKQRVEVRPRVLGRRKEPLRRPQVGNHADVGLGESRGTSLVQSKTHNLVLPERLECSVDLFLSGGMARGNLDGAACPVFVVRICTPQLRLEESVVEV